MPWLRIGAANIAVLLALYDLGVSAAVVVLALKLAVGSVLAGRFLTPFFWFAALGGIAALAGMLLAKLIAGRVLTVVGVSSLGGFLHATTQLVAARYLLVHSESVWVLLPLLGLVGVVSGAVTGMAARLVQMRLWRVS